MTRLRPRFLIGGALIAAAIIYLITTAIRNTAEYYLTVQEVAASTEKLQGQPLRIAGRVKTASVSWDPSSLKLVFTIVPIPAADGARPGGARAANSSDAATALRVALKQPDGRAQPRVDGGDVWAGEAKASTSLSAGVDGRIKRALSAPGASASVPAFVVVCLGQPKPDMFAENRDVIVEGKLTSSGTIAADQVLTSCPSKYVPESKK